MCWWQSWNHRGDSSEEAVQCLWGCACNKEFPWRPVCKRDRWLRKTDVLVIYPQMCHLPSAFSSRPLACLNFTIMYLILKVMCIWSHLLTLIQMIKENSWSLGKGSYQHFIHTHHIYICYLLYREVFQGLQKNMWLVVKDTQNVYEEIAFSFFFTFELLYSLNIQSWDGTFLQLKKGSSGLLNLHTQFFGYCN